MKKVHGHDLLDSPSMDKEESNAEEIIFRGANIDYNVSYDELLDLDLKELPPSNVD